MPIDAIKPLPHYRIDASGETTDQERRREEKLRDKKSKLRVTQTTDVSENTVNNPTPKPMIPCDLENVSQNVDTRGVIELLQPRPQNQTLAHRPTFQVRKLAVPESEAPSHQHVDKKY